MQAARRPAVRGGHRPRMRALCSRAEHGVLRVKVHSETEALIYLRAVIGAPHERSTPTECCVPGHYRRPTLRI